MSITRRTFMLSTVSLALYSAFPKLAFACGLEEPIKNFTARNVAAAALIAAGAIALTAFTPAGLAATVVLWTVGYRLFDNNMQNNIKEKINTVTELINKI